MRVTFWGTRGSIAVPGAETLRYGGNTACVEVRSASGTHIILDAGSGIRPLGLSLLDEGPAPVHGHLLLTHTHWDHIQGFPFFAPAFAAGNTFTIYAPQDLEKRLSEVLAGQMEYTYFPLDLEDLGARLSYRELGEETFTIDDVTVSTRYLNHTAVTLGYRISCDGASMVYITDHEPFLPYTADPADESLDKMLARRPAHRAEQALIDFVRDVDLLIQDAQYTEQEYARKINWGHGTDAYALNVALRAGARRLAFFHHDPARGDTALDELVARSQDGARSRGATALDIFGAAEGRTLLLQGSTTAPIVPEATAPASQPTAATLLIMDNDVARNEALLDALRADGHHLVLAGEGEDGLALALREHPDLVLVDARFPGQDGYAFCTALRGHDTLRQTPLIMLARRSDPHDAARAFATGISDYMIKPCSPAVLRSRVRTWLGRAAG